MAKYNTIMIGSDYTDAFKSIVALYKNNFISKDLISSIENDNVIVSGDGNTRFIFDPSINSYGVEGELKIDGKGATWFKTLRDKSEIVYGDNEWIDLLSNVASEYHKHNSYLEFLQIRKEFNSREAANHTEIINKFFKVFYPETNFYPSSNVKQEDCDIYGVSVIMDVSLVGETQKIIGRVFFKNINGRYYPLKAEDAIDVENQIDNLMSSETSKTSDEQKLQDRNLVDDVLVEVERLIEDDGKFAKSFVYASDKDKEIIDGMLAKGPQDFVTLTCSHLKVLGIFHVKMIYQYYEVLCGDTVAFKAVFDRNNDFSIACLNCSKNEYIVENNKIMAHSEEEDKDIQFNLDSSKDNFGIPNEDIDFIRTHSNLMDHCLAIHHTIGNKECHKIACLDETIIYRGAHYCKNCPYPQIIYTDINGVAHVLNSMAFASDKLSLVSKEDDNGNSLVEECDMCHRTFTKESLSNGTCESCLKALNPNSIKANVYDKYKFMLPVLFRLAKPKYAIEDNQFIIFNLNNKLRYFDKLEIDRKKVFKLKGDK